MSALIAASGVDNWTGMVLGIALLIFLFFALVFPERL